MARPSHAPTTACRMATSRVTTTPTAACGGSPASAAITRAVAPAGWPRTTCQKRNPPSRGGHHDDARQHPAQPPASPAGGDAGYHPGDERHEPQPELRRDRDDDGPGHEDSQPRAIPGTGRRRAEHPRVGHMGRRGGAPLRPAPPGGTATVQPPGTQPVTAPLAELAQISHGHPPVRLHHRCYGRSPRRPWGRPRPPPSRPRLAAGTSGQFQRPRSR